MLEQYFEDLFNTTKAGDATEESYYPDLKRLLENWAEKHKKKLYITPLPKRTEGGNPDFRIWDGKQHIVGYIEAKTPATEDLDTVERTEQLKRYRDTFPNLILTNFFEFRLYRNGERINKAIVGRPFIMHTLKTPPPAEKRKEFSELLEKFFAFSIPKTTTAKALAVELAKRTRFLRDNVITEHLREADIEGRQTLERYYDAFKEHLINSLSEKDFSDLFAQTTTYGLFAARSRATDGFSRESAYRYIPQTVGILRQVFRFVSSADLPKPMEWIIDDIAEVLANSDVKKIIENFHRERKGRDPIVHFYETFLAEYDPAEKKKRGVYYTPEPVVGYITRSIHALLKTEFKKEDGFGTRGVTVLDPASGTLTFLAEAARLAIRDFTKRYGGGGVQGLIRDHVIHDFYAFEIMMAPYTVGHLKMGFVLDEYGYRLADDERFQLYLTNTLELRKEEAKNAGMFEEALAKESADALKVKEETPIMVVMGNPPYSGISENTGDWITEKIEDYKRVDGEPLNERKHWLQDDYVKFYRFAQWKIEQAGAGVLGFITNHAWLDNPTFRGMRRSLMQTFDEIYILNLHGSTLKKEKTPEGGKDENVFDIQPGVAIGIFVKRKKKSNEPKIHYADVWSLREEKYVWLDAHDAESTKWQTVEPTKPFYFFVPRTEEGREGYEKFFKITDIFPINSTGIVTARDEFVLDHGKESLERKIRVFLDTNNDDEYVKSFLASVLGRKDVKSVENYAWRVREARETLRKEEDIRKYFARILYRPFDERWIFYHPSVVWRTREEVMRHMLLPNLALLTCRQLSSEGFYHALVSSLIADDSLVSNKTKERGYVFPLYLYGDRAGKRGTSLFGSGPKTGKKQANINSEIIKKLVVVYGKAPAPEEVFNYIYGILYANAYRGKYAEFLKADFPRIPFTKDRKLFTELAALGGELVDLHLLRSPALEKPIAKLQGSGDGHAALRKYDEKTKRVYINDIQYFENIASEAWNYKIGGYQVLDKWLKDRKDCRLSSEDIKHYCQIVTALVKTMEIQKEINKLYPNIERSPIG